MPLLPVLHVAIVPVAVVPLAALSVRKIPPSFPDVHRLVAGAVVGGVEDDRVLIRVSETRVVLGSPPVGRQAPVGAAVVGAEEVYSAGPDPVRIDRINLEDVVVPALIVERVREVHAAGLVGRGERVAQQKRVEEGRALVADPGRPGAGVTVACRSKDRVQTVMVVAGSDSRPSAHRRRPGWMGRWRWTRGPCRLR